MQVKNVPNTDARRFAKAIDKDKDGEVSDVELDAAAARPDPVKTRLLEKAFGDAYDPAAIRSGADLRALLMVAAPPSAVLTGRAPGYDKLFDGPRSEWVVAFGGDSHHAASEKAPPDVSQYRGFKSFLERLGFRTEARPQGVDTTGFAVYKKTIAAPPDAHEHALTVKVFSASQFEGAADEFQKTSVERRGYFSLSHAGEGLGMNIGGNYVRPENMLDTPAPALLMAPVACKSYEHFAAKVEKYMEAHGIAKEKLSFFGTSQEIEMMQPDGAMAVLKQIFAGALALGNGPMILTAADDAYNPIMASYDPESYANDRDRMVMDQDIRATPVVKAWIGGAAVELHRKRR